MYTREDPIGNINSNYRIINIQLNIIRYLK